MNKLKILFACIPTPNNRFMIDLKSGLETSGCQVIWDHEEFWKCRNNFDIIHIHWPEYLSYEIEKYLKNNDKITETLWNKLSQCLEYWKSNSKIVYTRHNTFPHSRQDNEIKKLYLLLASFSDLITHFANYSIEEFKKIYPLIEPIHAIIPHHNYASLPNKTTRENARQELGINDAAKVMLVFGAIKETEKQLIRSAFDFIPGKNKVLLAPGWKIPRRKIGYIRLREWVYKFECWLASRSNRFKLNLGFIEEDFAQYYLKAADFLFIPRTKELNSGNITLGCTFGLVVVGKNSADIGEILIETGNPTFRIGDMESLKKSILLAIKSKENGHGEKNRKKALEEWSIERIAKQYFVEMKRSIST